ncbi:hypothetical protein EIP86_002433 [Pleurotus ostreatoroseus]|nr:hypothetical protein EIP86_002433 [Pleurotus ostreatoroseus]
MAEEYGHQNEDECAVSCFIPGESDQPFEIFVSNELTKQDVAISIRIDGTFIGRYFLGLGQNILPGLYTQMAHVCERMQNAMQQIKRCAETVEETMGQLRFLQRQLDILEVRSRQLPPSAPPTEPMTVIQSVKTDPVAQEAMPQRRHAAVPRSPQLQWPA